MLQASKLVWAFRANISLIVFVTALVWVSVFPSGLDSSYLGASLANTPEELAETFGFSDAGSYLKAALELQSLGGLTVDKHWVINLWPPGMVLLNASLIELFGSNYAFAYALLLSIVWSMFFIFFALKLKELWGAVPSAMGSALLITSGPFQNWIFDNGLFYAEGFSQLFFLVGLITLLMASRANQVRMGLGLSIISGTSIAIAAYFRATFSILEDLLLASLILALVVWFAAARVRRLHGLRQSLQRLAVVIGGAWTSMFLLMEPWLQFTTLGIRGIRTWTGVPANMFRGVWVDRSTQPSFLADGGIGWGCEIDPGFCGEVRRFEEMSGQIFPIEELATKTVFTALSNPMLYLSDRWKFISEGWLSSEGSMGAPEIPSGLIALAGIIAFVILSIYKLLNGEPIFILLLAIICVLLLPQMVGHVEPRYFIPVKLMVLVLPWVVGSNHDKEKGFMTGVGVIK